MALFTSSARMGDQFKPIKTRKTLVWSPSPVIFRPFLALFSWSGFFTKMRDQMKPAKTILNQVRLVGAVVAYWLESWACNLKVAGSILTPTGIEGGDCEWTALSPPSIPRLRCPWARHRTPNCSPGAGEMAAHCSGCTFTVCVCVCSLLTAVCVHWMG